MYPGMAGILVGVSVLCGSVASLAGPLVFWAVIRLRFLPAEEQTMVDTFGEEYFRYQWNVRSWI